MAKKRKTAKQAAQQRKFKKATLACKNEKWKRGFKNYGDCVGSHLRKGKKKG